MNDEPINDLSTVPGWEQLVAAGNVTSVDPQVLERARAAVQRAAVTQETATVVATPRSRRRRRRSLVSALAVAASTAAAAVVVVVAQTSPPPVAGPDQLPGSASATPRQTILNPGQSTSCVESYTLTNLAHRTFAFDGTVESITPVAEPPDARFGRAEATFVVNQWFRGGAGARVTVIMPGSGDWPKNDLTYRAGTRLLVSGENQSHGEPLAMPIAWMGCGGFTQPYDAATAADWASTLNR
ncbi:hypothetical protein [Kribbella catacumbae]|uniref:hypothetical protein n=1 Tax=Kribbella catacumbae TaxID=460086 RepID=UPI00036F4431|nr:hypothetical protein [Kribbella catacumbae]